MPVPFTGNFDGNGHTVPLNITSGLTVPGLGTCAGLFALVGTSGLVHDITVTGTINITGTGTDDVYAGGIAGVTLPSAALNKVASSVIVTATGSGEVYAGGVVGVSQGTVSNASATDDVTADGDGEVFAGGVAGTAHGVVNNVYATGDVSATGDSDVHAGGIAGTAHGVMSNVYATGAISATSNNNRVNVLAGGIVGVALGAVNYAYATGDITATGNGTGDGDGDDKPMVGAGGIGGGNDGSPVRYTVALNSIVTAHGATNYKSASFRITSAPDGVVNGGPNHGKSDLTPTATGSGFPHIGGSKGANKCDGVSVGGSPYTAPNETWWKNTGFSGANWTTVWEWDTAAGLPKLR
jgi:hypothetical protein